MPADEVPCRSLALIAAATAELALTGGPCCRESSDDNLSAARDPGHDRHRVSERTSRSTTIAEFPSNSQPAKQLRQGSSSQA
jgi:hypothetical protein